VTARIIKNRKIAGIPGSKCPRRTAANFNFRALCYMPTVRGQK